MIRLKKFKIKWKGDLFRKRDKRTETQKEIDNLIDLMHKLDPTSEEYKKAGENLKELTEIRKIEEDKPKVVIPWGDIIRSIAMLFGIGIIVNAEKDRSITSKAFGWLKF